MYVQNIENANKNLPKSCICSFVTSLYNPLLLRYINSKIVRQIIATNQLTAACHAYSVLYQCASTLISHCQIIAALEKPMIGKNAADHIRILLCFAKSCPWSSSSAKDRDLILRPNITQVPTIINVPNKYQFGLRKLFLPFNIGSSATAAASAQ